MKPFTSLLTALLLCSFHLSSFHAQDLSDLFPAAHYTLINTADDALGLQPPIELHNSPFSGNDGVFCNGIIPSLPNGSSIRTPSMAALYNAAFAVQVEFKISSLDNEIRAVLVCGEGYRYLGFTIWMPTLYRMVINNNEYFDVPGLTPDENVWHKLTMIYHSAGPHIEYYLDGAQIGDIDEALIRSGTDDRITNIHLGGDWVFKGYLRNLVVYGSEATSGLQDHLNIDSEIKAFPNPAQSTIRLEYPEFKATEWTLKDVSGALITTGYLDDTFHQLDVSFLSPGLYILQLFDPNGMPVAVKKFVKGD